MGGFRPPSTCAPILWGWRLCSCLPLQTGIKSGMREGWLDGWLVCPLCSERQPIAAAAQPPSFAGGAMAPRALGLLGLALALFCGADACTRILLHGVDDSYVLSGRSQDWCAARGAPARVTCVVGRAACGRGLPMRCRGDHQSPLEPRGPQSGLAGASAISTTAHFLSFDPGPSIASPPGCAP